MSLLSVGFYLIACWLNAHSCNVKIAILYFYYNYFLFMAHFGDFGHRGQRANVLGTLPLQESSPVVDEESMRSVDDFFMIAVDALTLG